MTKPPIATTSDGETPIGARPRVIIADAHRLVAAGLATLLAGECEIAGTANNGDDLLSEIRRLHPDIVLLDISMPQVNGVDLILKIRRITPAPRVIAVTMKTEPGVAATAFRAGVSAFVFKDGPESELLEAVHHVMEHQSYVTPLVAGEVFDALMNNGHSGTPMGQLTLRERQVLELLAVGHSMKQAAGMLKVAPRTVAFHKYRIMRRLNIKNSAELVRFAVDRQIV